jgi:ppGpp synthetase/RelA/SpoT-type nucleotidyltranferase
MDSSNNQGQDSETRMTEAEFQQQWHEDKAVYNAWGSLVVSTILGELTKAGKINDSFLKIPAKHRLKEDQSLIDKAFYRPGKTYSDPYNDIEDKVGARFVVLLVEDIRLISEIINQSEIWSFDACKHFDEDKEREPLLFTYQSVHFVLRPKKAITIGDCTITTDTPCEVQIRTLLQHAHAELTHDAIYKAKRAVEPKVHRTVAKSMALIETTDDFFTEVTQQLNQGPVEEFGILSRLDALYFSYTGIKPQTQKSILTIFDEFEDLVDETLIDSIETYINKNPAVAEIIKAKFSEGAIYKQSTVLLLYWMLKRKKQKLIERWPFDRSMLIPLANDIGVSTRDDN